MAVNMQKVMKESQDVRKENAVSSVTSTYQQQECVPLSSSVHTPCENGLYNSPNTSSLCHGNMTNDPRYVGMVPNNHALLATSVWPGSNVCYYIRPGHEWESLCPSLVYTYYPADMLPTESNLSTTSLTYMGGTSQINGAQQTTSQPQKVCDTNTYGVCNLIDAMTGLSLNNNSVMDPSVTQLVEEYPGYAMGYTGLDGCWYPGHLEETQVGMTKEECEFPLISNLPEQARKFPQQDINKGNNDEQSCIESSASLTKRNMCLQSYNCIHLLDEATEVLGRPRLTPSFENDGQLCVVDIWQQHMKLLFRNLRDPWEIYNAHPERTFGWHWSTFEDYGKVRFYCKVCKDGWTSMSGVVVFYYRLFYQKEKGIVFYRICGQKCRSCQSDHFELPLWYPEEAQKVITNLYYKIAYYYYGLVTPKINTTRRVGKPKDRHDSDLCQGCSFGICKLGARVYCPE